MVPARNASRHLSRCVPRLIAELGRRVVDVIVVDNGSTDDSADVARRRGARVVSQPGVRVGACRNAGAAAADGDVLAFVDADNEIDESWVAACLRTFESPDVGAAGYLYHPPQPATWVQRIHDAFRDRPAVRASVAWLSAGNLAVRRDVFERVGGFDESLEACEDVALCRAIRAAGYDIVAEPGMGSVHHGDPATLRALFFGELWRGRHNLRVSLRGPLSARDVPSVLFPPVFLFALAAALLGILALPWLGALLPGIAAAVLGGIIGLRALLLAVRGRLVSPLAWAQALAVAATYEAARALSLVTRATHQTRTTAVRHA